MMEIFSRYLFLRKLFNFKWKIRISKKTCTKSKLLNNNLITAQTKQWILEENYKDFSKYFLVKIIIILSVNSYI